MIQFVVLFLVALGVECLGTPNRAIRILNTNLGNAAYSVSVEDAKAFTLPGADKISENAFPIRAHSGVPLSQKYINILSAPESDLQSAAGVQVPVKGIQHSGVNVVYGTNLKVGGEDITVTIDTGSSDTWLVGTNYKCLSKTTKREVAAKRCKFGPAYSKTKTFSQMTGQYFETGYADKTFVTGIMGKETVSLGNITVMNQPIGLVDRAAWEGDGISSGLMGLAYPSITNAWVGTGPMEGGNKGANVPYTPIFTAMHRQKLIAPYFSLALNRPKEAPGVIALGGLPGLPIKYNSTFAKAPLQQLTVSSKGSTKGVDGFEDYKFYIVNVDSFTVGSSVVNTKSEVIIDSGSPLTYLPKDIAAAIHAKWSPPLKQDRLTKQYLYTCGSSKPPKIGVTFGGKTVHFDNEDLSIVASGNLCLSGIQPVQGKGMSAVSVLGGSFLKGVVAVFDVGAAEMRFANRIR